MSENLKVSLKGLKHQSVGQHLTDGLTLCSSKTTTFKLLLFPHLHDD